MKDDAARGALESWLQDRNLGAEVVRLTRIGGGASRQTWLLTVRGADAARVLALRMDTAGGGVVPTTLEREFKVLGQLYVSGIRVPEPLAFERDSRPLGERFYVRRGFEGVAGSHDLPAEAKRGLGLEIAGELARLHGLDVDSVEMPDRPEREDPARAIQWELDHWFDHWTRHELVSPGLAFVYRWLRQNIPATGGGVSVLWGDVGLANVVASTDGRLLALSDWELATYGDPNRDVASGYWRGLGRWLPLEDFERAYVEAGGRALDPDAITYYQVFMNWQVALFTHCAGVTVGTGQSSSLHPALLATWLHRQNIAKALRLIRQTIGAIR